MAKIDKLAIAQKILVRVLLVLVCITSSKPRPAEGSAGATTTPIRHLIVIVGENHTFDNLFGVYQPAERTNSFESAFRGNHQSRRNAWSPLQ